MAYKLDENLPFEAAAVLSSLGLEIKTVSQQKMNGCSDTELIEVCTAEELALITLDLDFSDVRVYPPEKHAGIIVLRAGNMGKKKVIDLLIWICPLLKQDNFYGKLWIVEENKIRIRSKKEEMK